MAYKLILRNSKVGSINTLSNNGVIIEGSPVGHLAKSFTCDFTTGELVITQPYLFPLVIRVAVSGTSEGSGYDYWDFDVQNFRYKYDQQASTSGHDVYDVNTMFIDANHIVQDQLTGNYGIVYSDGYVGHKDRNFTIEDAVPFKHIYVHPYAPLNKELLQPVLLTALNSAVALKDYFGRARTLFYPIYTNAIDWTIESDDGSFAVAYANVYYEVQHEELEVDDQIRTNFSDGNIDYRPVRIAGPASGWSGTLPGIWNGSWVHFTLLCPTTLYWGDQPDKLLTSGSAVNLKLLKQSDTSHLLSINSPNSNTWVLTKPPLVKNGDLEVVAIVDSSDAIVTTNYSITTGTTIDTVTLTNGKNIKRIYAWYLNDDDDPDRPH